MIYFPMIFLLTYLKVKNKGFQPLLESHRHLLARRKTSTCCKGSHFSTIAPRNSKKNNTESGFIAESSFNAESNLMLSTLPALYKRGIAKMLFLSICFQSFITLISWNEKPSLSSTASFRSSIVFSFKFIASEANASRDSESSKYSIPSPS